MQGRGAYKRVKERLERLSDHGLQREGLDRRADPCFFHQLRTHARHRLHRTAALDGAAIGFHCGDGAVLNDQFLNFGQLMNFNATLGRLLGVTPGHGVMASGCTVHVPQTGDHWQVTRI
ncbi:hypothetical protein D3C80_1362570 [compost metagenome]